MNFNSRITAGVLTAVVFSTFAITPTLAQAREDIQDLRQNTQEQLEANRGNFSEERCDIIKDAIQSRADIYSSNRDNHVERYNNVKDRIAEVLDSVEQAGYDVTTLRGYLTELDTKVVEFRNNTETAISTLLQSGDLVCAEDQTQFEQNVELVRGVLSEVRADAVEIRDYVINVIRPELLDLRDQIQADTESTTST